jgi:hypothetical protein
MTESDKVMARYQMIMEQTNKTAGDFANTSDSLANSSRIAGAKRPAKCKRFHEISFDFYFLSCIIISIRIKEIR